MAASMGDRIRQAREDLGKTQIEIAKRCEISKQALSQLENDITEPSGKNLVKLANALGVREAWIVSGITPKERKVSPVNDTIESEIDSRRHSLVRGYRIAEMDVKASAGPGALVDSDSNMIGEWELPKDLIRSATNSPAERVRVITIVGDSMTPMFQPNEKVLVDTGDKTPTPPGVFIVWDGLGLVAKRVEHIPFSEPAAVKISSENPKYGSYERVLDEAYIQGRVLGRCLVWT